jgi:hypothetical protein
MFEEEALQCALKATCITLCRVEPVLRHTGELRKEYEEVLNLLKQHMSNAVKGSAYNWVRPSLWAVLFGDKGADKDKEKERQSVNQGGR